MTSIEAHFRLLIERESIQSSHGRLLVIADSVKDEACLNALYKACWHLSCAAEALRRAPSVLTLEQQYELSLATVKEGKKA